MEQADHGEGLVEKGWPGSPAPGSELPVGRQAYRHPQLRALGSAADLLEVLGPAQANYGGM